MGDGDMTLMAICSDCGKTFPDVDIHVIRHEITGEIKCVCLFCLAVILVYEATGKGKAL
jgi:hypothetical protein